MITEYLTSENNTTLKTHTNPESLPIIYMEEGVPGDAYFNYCVFQFSQSSEIDWLIKKLKELKKEHFTI